MTTELCEMIHHFSHEINIGHENRCITFFEKIINSKETLLKLLFFCVSHDFSKLVHCFGCICLVSSIFNRLNEKLQRRFLEDDGGVRGLRLSWSRWCHCVSRNTIDVKLKNNYRVKYYSFITTFDNYLFKIY